MGWHAQVEIPQAGDPPRPAREWKLLEPELASRLNEWFEVVELVITPSLPQEAAERNESIARLVKLHFDSTSLLVGGRRRMMALRHRESSLLAQHELWSLAHERLRLQEVIWAATKIQALHR